jgi:hypothetical protein
MGWKIMQPVLCGKIGGFPPLFLQRIRSQPPRSRSVNGTIEST